MQEIHRDLLSCLITFLKVLGAMILLFPFGWVFILLGVLPELKCAVHEQLLEKKILQRQKVLIEQVFFSREFPRGFLIKKRFFSRRLQGERRYFRLIVCGFPRLLLPAILL